MLKKMPLTLQFYRELPKAEMSVEDIQLKVNRTGELRTKSQIR